MATRRDAWPMTTIAAMAEATAATRNRTVDLLRAAALLVVVLGHWLLAVVDYAGPGKAGLVRANLLAVQPATQWLTLALQVMPLFFVVGGFSHAASLASANRRGVPYAAWLRGRTVRLLRPVAALLAVWVPLMIGLTALGPRLGLDEDLLRLGGLQVVVPLWFLAVYLGVVALAPVMLRLHGRWGARVPLALGAAALSVDVIVYGLGWTAPGWANFAFVWLALHQLGFAWHDGRLRRRRWLPLALAAAGLAALLGLVLAAGYPLSMVGADDGGRSNTMPPSFALVALGVWQLGIVLLAEARLRRWLERPRVWRAVVAANTVAMTLYLWHLTALTLVVLAAYLTGAWPDVTPAGGAWWALRPLWLALLCAAVTPFVVWFAPVERAAAAAARLRASATTRRRDAVVALAGTLAAAGAIALLVTGGLYAPGTAVAVTPLALLVTGMVALGAVRLPSPGSATVGDHERAAHDSQ